MGPGAQPDRAALERPPLVLAHAAPHPGVLAAVDGPAASILEHRAPPADLLGYFNLEERRPAVSDREEQLRIYLTTGGHVTPVHGVHSFSASRLVIDAGRHAPLSACEAFHELCDMSGTGPYSRSLLVPSRLSPGIRASPDTLRRATYPCRPRSIPRRDVTLQARVLPSQQGRANARGRGERVLRI